jgi:hypothetical protein
MSGGTSNRALTALTNHNLAAGFGVEFAGEKPPDDLDGRQRCARAAVNAVDSMEVMSRWDAKRARLEADRLQRWAPDGAAPLSAADGAALVYLITHAKLAAAKVGIADTSGLRLAQHRREGWQILAVFRVSAKSAAAIETDVLKWWRGALGLPSYLTRDHMPQGGWTETVAAGPRRPGGNGDAHLQSGGCVAAPDACLTRAPRNSTPGPSRGVAKRRVKMI